MSTAKTNISWTDRTWNCIHGCSKVSSGCAHCYAETISLKFGLTKLAWTKANASQNVLLRYDKLDEPRHWRKPAMVFVNSMSDLFHELVPDDFIKAVFETMEACPQHTFQVLTKRAWRMEPWCQKYQAEPLPNVWLGVSVENQAMAQIRIPQLLKTPSAVRWLSCEPLLDALDLSDYLQEMALINGEWRVRKAFIDRTQVASYETRPGLDWVVCGGESGKERREMDEAWALSLRDQCLSAEVPFFFKQHSAFKSEQNPFLEGVEWRQMPALSRQESD